LYSLISIPLAFANSAWVIPWSSRATVTGRVSSEPLLGENIWLPLEPGDVVGVDSAMMLYRATAEHHPLSVVA
jgi:hypothetical protein